MRAKFIRGEDPKTVMDIGDKYLRIRDRMEMGARIICRDYDLDIKTIKTELKENGISVEFPGRQPNIVHPYKYWMYYDKEREHYWVGYSLLKNDEIGDQKPCNDLEKAMLETRIFLNKFNWTAKGAVHESSMNFERGVDPKTSMRIGYYYARSQEFMDFIKEEMSWNDPVIEMPDDGNFTYHCLPGNSVIGELREAVEKFGWKNVIRVNKDPDDWGSRHHDDGSTRHYYVLKFKKDKKLKESLNFERGMDPKDSMELGDVTGRKMKVAYEQIKGAINRMIVDWWGGIEILHQKDNPYMRIKEKVHKEYVQIGIENQVGESTYFYYLVYVPYTDEDLTDWAAGYEIHHKSKYGYSPNVKAQEQDEIPYDTLEDAINKMEYWYKNL